MTENRLKFRVYDIRRKVYFNDPVPPLNSDGTLAFQSSHPDFQKYYITEFCTGLKDNCGNLIYEGDVVQYWYNQKTNTGTIFWNNEFARFCIANNETHCPEDSNCLMFVADKKIIEIIGNVHEQAKQKE